MMKKMNDINDADNHWNVIPLLNPSFERTGARWMILGSWSAKCCGQQAKAAEMLGCHTHRTGVRSVLRGLLR
jgi:hypothetical protein